MFGEALGRHPPRCSHGSWIYGYGVIIYEG
jgi:hypothetical protein